MGAGHYRRMDEWVAFKGAITAATGLDHGVLNVLGSFVLCILAAWIWRRPLSHGLPWLSVLIAAVFNELASGLADGTYEAWEVAATWRDLFMVMILPTALLIVCRYAPQIFCSRIDRQFIVPLGKNPRRHDVIEADFHEVGRSPRA